MTNADADAEMAGSDEVRSALGQAEQACAQCRRRKKGCDKLRPRCTQCRSHDLNCQYGHERGKAKSVESIQGIRKRLAQLEHSISSAQRQQIPTQISGVPISATFDSGLEVVPDMSQWQTLLSESLDGSDIAENLYVRVCNIIQSSGTTIFNIWKSYFSHVQKWLPVLSKQRTHDSFMACSPQKRADVALLLLSMYLIISTPPQKSKVAQGPMYLVAKSLYYRVLPLQPVTLEIVQSGLLIAAYEYAHGLSQTAYMSMGCIVRAASALGLPRKHDPAAAKDHATWLISEEEKSLWWGCIILDRLICLEARSKGISLPIQQLETPEELPLESNKWDAPQGNVTWPQSHLSITSGPSTQIKGFGRTAQSCKLLGDILSLVSKPPSSPWNQLEISQLDSALQSILSEVIKESADTWDSYCSALGTTIGALCTLHLSRSTSNHSTTGSENDGTLQSLLALQVMVRLVLEMANTYAADPGAFPLDGVPPLAFHMIFQAAQIHIHGSSSRERDNIWLRDLEVLRFCLWSGGGRWNNSREFLKIIDDAVDLPLRRFDI